ncbi:O-acetylhomoserine aminocarboxypropyltransferase/cysteine synthase family protein [Hellea balneolensis]|uniref:O-acetylhomoserine aminocarboxypropyltransferase/cysteine synthase family protein n=1 Tax=Hellea balneolensis TaxID=287478 RepID=UPI0004154D34|nr:aminotransferase class I/II-fold pyridoxal phosphate-dependent enzyme [Hellea balneolensis]
MTNSSYFKPATIALHTGYTPESDYGSRAVPIYQTTSYAFDSVESASSLFNVEQGGHIYSRISNPTVAVLEQRLAALEGGAGAICTASGMSALFATFISLCSAGDHIVSSEQIYGSTATTLRYTLKRFGITTDFIDINDSKALKAAIKPNTKMVFCESISNPGMQVSNLPEISKVANAAGVPVVIDATFATPALNRPLEHGANIVVHSITKWIGGHGAAIGGCIIDGGNFDWDNGRFPEMTEPYAPFHGMKFWEEFGPTAFVMKIRSEAMRDLGAALSPHNAFLILQGVETLELRMQKHVANTAILRDWLSEQKGVTWVRHPEIEAEPHVAEMFPKGAGSMLCFGVTGGREGGAAFINTVSLASHLANVGDSRTLVLHPASTTHSRLTKDAMEAAGIPEDLIRVSVGLEDFADIKADFAKGLKAALRAAG